MKRDTLPRLLTKPHHQTCFTCTAEVLKRLLVPVPQPCHKADNRVLRGGKRTAFSPAVGLQGISVPWGPFPFLSPTFRAAALTAPTLQAELPVSSTGPGHPALLMLLHGSNGLAGISALVSILYSSPHNPTSPPLILDKYKQDKHWLPSLIIQTRWGLSHRTAVACLCCIHSTNCLPSLASTLCLHLL